MDFRFFLKHSSFFSVFTELTPWNIIFLEKLIIGQMIKKLPMIHYSLHKSMPVDPVLNLVNSVDILLLCPSIHP
jgi:hypothetical protein